MTPLDQIDLWIHARLSPFGWPTESLVELILAAVCGGLIGLEREVRGRQAGFRTNLLVCVGSALVMIVSNHVARVAWPSQPGVNVQVSVDPTRIAYGVMGGIGFLGAGAIIKNGNAVRGLTTAAGLWCVAAIGLSAGIGMYLITVAATILVVGVLWILDYFEGLLPSTHYRDIRIRCRWEPEAIARVVEWLKRFKFKVIDVRFERTKDLVDVDVDVIVAFGRKTILYDLERQAQKETDFHLMAIRVA